MGVLSLPHRIQTSCGAHPASYPLVTRVLTPGVKRSGREAHRSPESSVEDKNAGSYISAPQYIFMAWCLVKHRNSPIFVVTLMCYVTLRYA